MVKKQVADILDKMKGCQLNRIYYVASGESLAPVYAIEYIADREAEEIAIEIYDSSEFTYRKPAALGPHSVVIVSSDDAKENLEAARFAKEKGAITIGLSAKVDSLLKKEVDYFIKHDSLEVDSLINSEYSVFYLLTTGIIQEREPNAYHDLYEGMIRNIANMDVVLTKAVTHYESFIEDFKDAAKKSQQIYAVSSGTCYSQAYYLSVSKQIRKKGLHVKAIHAGEFIQSDQSNMLEKEELCLFFLGLDATRPVEEKALSLVGNSNDQVFVLDGNDIDFTGIDRPFAKVMPPLLFAKIMRQFVS